MPLVTGRRLAGALVMLAMAGCATPPVEFGIEDRGVDLVWPGAPQVPRYRYLGEITGEGNYREAEGVEPGAAVKVLRWLVGLFPGSEPIVRLQRPQGGTVDRQGRILVTDVGSPGVFVFDPSAERLAVWREAAPGQNFAAPIGIAHTPMGGFYVADSALGFVARLTAEGEPGDPLGAAVLQRPTGIALDPLTGDLYVADTEADDIKRFDRRGELVSVIGGPGQTPGLFNAPTFLVFRDGELFVTDTLNARVQVLDRDGQPRRIIGSRGLYVGNFVRPKGVAVDEEGLVYTTEAYYDYLLVFEERGQFLMGIGGSGRQPGRFLLPAGVWTDGRGRLFVSDMMNARVVVLQFLGG